MVTDFMSKRPVVTVLTHDDMCDFIGRTCARPFCRNPERECHISPSWFNSGEIQPSEHPSEAKGGEIFSSEVFQP